MALLAVLAASGFILIAVGAGVQAWAQGARARRLAHALPLVPNVLLAKWPIAFVTGPRSAFWSVEYWSFAPRFLAAHGFVTLALDLPWRDASLRERALRLRLDRSPTPCHLIFDSASRRLAEATASWHHARTASITVTVSAGRNDPERSAHGIRLLTIDRPTARTAALSGRCARSALALHRASIALRRTGERAPATEEIAAFDESLHVERQILAHAVSLARDDL